MQGVVRLGVVTKGIFGAVLGIAVAVAGTGCGAGGTLSREQYVSRLNAICDEFRAREKQIGEPQTLADLRERGPQVVAAFDKVVEEVGKLKAPDELAPEAERFVDLGERQQVVLQGLVDAAKDGDVTKALELAATNEALNKEATMLARRVGAAACAAP
jgi:hypothetical protein